ncbi:MAG: hypothetical protein R3F49_10920 [Planctomycetota bacterium]
MRKPASPLPPFTISPLAMATRPAILMVILAHFSTPLRAQTCAMSTDLGAINALGVSEDGSVIVGQSVGYQAYRWTSAGGLQDLGTLGGLTSRAYDVSGDGSVVVGSVDLSNGYQIHPFRWTLASGMQDLGTLGGPYSEAYGVSADGSVVVGWSRVDHTTGNVHAFRWTTSGGMQDLGVLPGSDYSEARGVSADGSVVVGHSTYGAFRWTAAGGMQGIGAGVANDVSADGSVVVGDTGASAFRWTAAGGMQDLGSLGGPRSEAYGVSADGSVVVGRAQSAVDDVGFRWTATGGMQELTEFSSLGAGYLPWGFARGVSADGTVVVGRGLDGGGTRVQSSILGNTYCRPTVANSTGCGGIVLANGDPRLATGALELTATLLPQNSFGFFLTSQAQDLVLAAGGSQGNLCLGGSIGRLVGPGQVIDSGSSGSFTLEVNLNAIPAPTLTGHVAVQPGETWNFQAWHRDTNPTLTSNFTDAVSVTFQ